MPELTIASAVSRMRRSLMSQWNRFQLFHPIGGVGAKPAAAPRTAGATATPLPECVAQAIAKIAAPPPAKITRASERVIRPIRKRESSPAIPNESITAAAGLE